MKAADWKQRFEEQAQWTKTLRQYIFKRLPIKPGWKACEIGCGFGSILPEASQHLGLTIGLDIALDSLTGQPKTQNAPLINANACFLPFRQNAFNLCFCHYFLLWIKEPQGLLEEVKRVLQPGGYLAFFAEPDYALREAEPTAANALACMQNLSLALQGVDLHAGSQLSRRLKDSGFELIEYGQITEGENIPPELSRSERDVLRSDWQFLIQHGGGSMSRSKLEFCLSGSIKRWQVPTFYALARLKK
ncbi:MAG: class I SAM-dependent methyltransferase [Anaerolineaceae bacterium]|nr:class I SAM-dependent methyltransferase [Anaerolineaceae bacterium]